MPRKTQSLDDLQIAQIGKLAAVMTQEQIADFFGFSERTLRRRLKADKRAVTAYKKGRAAAVAGVGASLLEQARGGNLTAQIFYLKTQAGWQETGPTTPVEGDGRQRMVVEYVGDDEADAPDSKTA